MSNKNHINKIRGSLTLTIIITVIFIFLMDILSYYGDRLRYKKYRIEKEISLLHTKYIDTYTKLTKFELFGELKKEIEKRNLNLIQGEYPPFIIYENKSKKNNHN